VVSLTTQSCAALRLGDPVSRGPYTSVRKWSVRMICELSVASRRIFQLMSRSIFSCADGAVIDSDARANARTKDVERMRDCSPGIRDPGSGIRLFVAGCSLPVAGCRMPVAGCRLPVQDPSMAQIARLAVLKPGVTLDSLPGPRPSDVVGPATHRIISGEALIFWDPKHPGKKRDAIDTDQITPAADCVSESLETLDERWKAGSFA